MGSLVLKCMLLCALMHGAVCACMLKNHTIWIERHDCGQCTAINTTICSGYCYTQVNTHSHTVRGNSSSESFLIQRSCVPLSLVYRAAHVPGCPQDLNPQLFYPAANRCSCRRCDTRTHHCVRNSRILSDRCTVTLGGVKSQTPPYVGT
uniref:Glycoprotein hormone subunit beta domain-containing protein n=1 Tax=Sander lucioperca TaxID=283035 RepID=A0A8C9YUP6_SANLU